MILVYKGMEAEGNHITSNYHLLIYFYFNFATIEQDDDNRYYSTSIT